MTRDALGAAMLALARAGWSYGVARNTDDAPLLAQQVKPFGGLLGQTDDALRTVSRTILMNAQCAPVDGLPGHEPSLKNKPAAAAGWDANHG